MEVKVIHTGKTKFQIQARQHVIDCDQPVENGGDDAAMTPPEIFLASLGSCAAFYAAQYLSSRKLADHGLEVSVVAEKLREPARLGNFYHQGAKPGDVDGRPDSGYGTLGALLPDSSDDAATTAGCDRDCSHGRTGNCLKKARLQHTSFRLMQTKKGHPLAYRHRMLLLFNEVQRQMRMGMMM